MQNLILGSHVAESCMVSTQDNTIVIGKVRASTTSAHDRNTDKIVRGQERSTKTNKDNANQWVDVVTEWQKMTEKKTCRK